MVDFQNASTGLFPRYSNDKNVGYVKDSLYCAFACWACSIAYRYKLLFFKLISMNIVFRMMIVDANLNCVKRLLKQCAVFCFVGCYKLIKQVYFLLFIKLQIFF